jgi:hypothetical protein
MSRSLEQLLSTLVVISGKDDSECLEEYVEPLL